MKTIQDFIKEKGEEFDKKFGKDGPDRNSDSIGVIAGCDDCVSNIELREKHKSFLTSSFQEAYELGKVEMIREVNEKIKEMYLKKPEKDRAYGNGYVKGFNQAVSIVESFLTPSSDTKDDLETNK